MYSHKTKEVDRLTVSTKNIWWDHFSENTKLTFASVVHMPEIKKPVGPGGSREKACRVQAISGSGKYVNFLLEKPSRGSTT